MYAYKKTNGEAHDLRFIRPGMEQPDDIVVEGDHDELPDIETLHDPIVAEQLRQKAGEARKRKEAWEAVKQRLVDEELKERGV